MLDNITQHCPNCGKLCRGGECCHSSGVKTAWGYSTLYGVCAECAAIHEDRRREVDEHRPLDTTTSAP